MWTFVEQRWQDILYRAYQHTSLVVQAVLLATVIALVLAVVAIRSNRLKGLANIFTAVGLTIPSFALLGILLPLVGIGAVPSVLAVAFYAVLPILRNAIVGLESVDETLLESARGMGLSSTATLLKVRLPLAWPVILAGVRTSTQMSFGVAAIAAYALGPGLGGYIFMGLAQVGGANATNYALVGTIGVVLLALVLDLILVGVGRLTIPRGIRA